MKFTQAAPTSAGTDLRRTIPMETQNRRGAKLLLAVAMLLLATPALAERFDYPSPSRVLGKTATTITLLVPFPFGIENVRCPSTGILGKYCNVVEPFDTGGFEGEVYWAGMLNGWDLNLQVAEADQGFPLASPDWAIDGCIDGISTDGPYIVFDVDDGFTNVDLYCDTTTPNTLAPLCAELEVDDCTDFVGRFFREDHDLRDERELVVIRATR